jgi:aminoglycoside phosphotransferase (APT) family kinase protein
MATDGNALRAPLERWLAETWRNGTLADLRVGEIAGLTAGFSAETLVVPVSYTAGGQSHEERLVMRLENPEPAIYPQQSPACAVEIEIQYRTMQALQRAAKIPLAPLVGYEPDPALLGTPFFVMGFVEGQVPLVHPAYTQEGFFREAQPEQRRRMLEDGLRVLAEVHRVDWRDAGFDWLVPTDAPPTALRQLELWEEYTRRELGERVHPTLDRTFRWLRDNLPDDASPGVSWGDSRPGNMIWDDFRCACVTDFENVAIAPWELDLGWWLMFDRCCHEGIGVERLPGEPSRGEQREFYADCAGRTVGDTRPYEVFGAMRYAAVTVRVMNRGVARGVVPADHSIWLNNPGSTCLTQLGMEPA